VLVVHESHAWYKRQFRITSYQMPSLVQRHISRARPEFILLLHNISRLMSAYRCVKSPVQPGQELQNAHWFSCERSVNKDSKTCQKRNMGYVFCGDCRTPSSSRPDLAGHFPLCVSARIVASPGTATARASLHISPPLASSDSVAHGASVGGRRAVDARASFLYSRHARIRYVTRRSALLRR
jgi:hypothetical protein